MPFEIELKAWIDDPAALEKRLKRVALFESSYDKQDSYFSFPGNTGNPDKTLRLRREGETVTVTLKDKSVIDGIEQNREREFTVSSYDDMKHLLETTGCFCYIEKRKKGKKFKAGELNLELSEVVNLGWFLEIEKLIDSDDTAAVEKARNEIRSMLTKLKIGEDKIEPRYYTEMLQGKS